MAGENFFDASFQDEIRTTDAEGERLKNRASFRRFRTAPNSWKRSARSGGANRFRIERGGIKRGDQSRGERKNCFSWEPLAVAIAFISSHRGIEAKLQGGARARV